MSKKTKWVILGACFLTLVSTGTIYACSMVYPNDETASIEEPTAIQLPVAIASGAPARDYYVSPEGNDTNPGTVNEPLVSIQKAIDSVEPGGTVYLLEGSYRQTVRIAKSGSQAQGYITLRNAEGQTAILDGTGVQLVADGAIHIDNASYVRVEGLEISHYRTDSADITPIGIRVSGGGSNIEISGNRINDIGTDAGHGKGGGNAHGIAVYGNTATPLQHLAIIQNELYNLKLGASEAMAINGNVDGFRILQNTVHDNNNIGIDVIGFEGTAPNPDQDQARNGMIAENYVYNISSFGNPAYGNEYSAAGIYVDGGKNITIMNNDVHDNDYGIELASEHAGGLTTEVEVSLNRIYHNRAAGITLGGYDESRGGTSDCIIKENELIENNSHHLGYGEINFAFDTRNNELRNNSIRANEDGLMITNEFPQNEGNTVDFNQYISKEQAHWIWKGEIFDDFSMYQIQTGNDLNSDLSIISSGK
ncbi:right-handed parallel beta-helix repeat-containing protein [Paenibacillus alginolyticus]|uniref:Right-handed parallel beta-helix repeat-containing protein n=1 Tax=Paenibacillus alginolyticus TaxID=59839 RepID=A0ABT4G5A1_9BACL|nr:NosD domain-containing protein [Paenibacillus alginolyticus]MCY9667150.1 right-handed parallel beta-helix repeat-containing protein [Paenibacillus alginolyticus]MCY9691346.1 right-handed parallel beta-helix repeat-containing protein [Paenibacillus alginolyticus]MEC0146456.1 NosD domain-containing protein [Paenibacillus alginolyticus]